MNHKIRGIFFILVLSITTTLEFYTGLHETRLSIDEDRRNRKRTQSLA